MSGRNNRSVLLKQNGTGKLCAADSTQRTIFVKMSAYLLSCFPGRFRFPGFARAFFPGLSGATSIRRVAAHLTRTNSSDKFVEFIPQRVEMLYDVAKAAYLIIEQLRVCHRELLLGQCDSRLITMSSPVETGAESPLIHWGRAETT